MPGRVTRRRSASLTVMYQIRSHRGCQPAVTPAVPGPLPVGARSLRPEAARCCQRIYDNLLGRRSAHCDRKRAPTGLMIMLHDDGSDSKPTP